MTRFNFSILLSLMWIALTSGQESPYTTIPKFAETDGNATFRTNVCGRQRLLFEEEIELRDALKGLDISVAMTNYAVLKDDAFFSLVDGKIKEEDPGLFVVIMDEIARRGDFRWRNSFAAIDPVDPAVDGDKSWTDLLVWEVEHFDIAADYWARNVQRMAKGISFPLGWYDGSIVMVRSESPQADKFDFWAHLVPFDVLVWVAIVAAIFFTGGMYCFLERLNQSSDERQLDDKPHITVFLSALTFTGHFEFQPETNAARILSFSWSFWSLIMISAYTANMASFLVSKNELVARINTIDDAMRTGTPVCVVRGAVMDEVLSDQYPDLNLVRKGSEQEMFEGLNKGWYGGGGGCGVLLTNLGTFDIFRSKLATNSDCSLASDKRVVLNLPAGFATAVDSAIMCTSLVSYVMDLHLTEMRSDGFIENSWNDHVNKIKTVQCPESVSVEQDDNFSLGLEDLGGIFITHMALSAVALTFALYQYYYTKYRKPTKALRPITFTSVRKESLNGIFNSTRSFNWSSNRDKSQLNDIDQVTEEPFDSTSSKNHTTSNGSSAIRIPTNAAQHSDPSDDQQLNTNAGFSNL